MNSELFRNFSSFLHFTTTLMSTRSKTRKASTSQALPASPVVAKPEPRPRRKTTDPNSEKENETTITAKATSKTKAQKTEMTPTKEVNCTCSRDDDGSPMVRCALCHIWCVLSYAVLANLLLMTRQVSFHVRGFVRTRGGRYKCVPFHFLTFCVFDDFKVFSSVHRAPSQQAVERPVST